MPLSGRRRASKSHLKPFPLSPPNLRGLRFRMSHIIRRFRFLRLGQESLSGLTSMTLRFHLRGHNRPRYYHALTRIKHRPKLPFPNL
jgi:hypothetical protein